MAEDFDRSNSVSPDGTGANIRYTDSPERTGVGVALDPKPFRPFKTKESYLVAMKEDLAEWFNILFQLEMTEDNFFKVLETGVVLCQLANNIRQMALEFTELNNNVNTTNSKIPVTDVIYRRNVNPGTFLTRDNICNFITWCRGLGIPDCLLFETDDLVMRKNERSVVLCLLEVARRGARFGMVAPCLIQLEREIDAEILGEKLPEAEQPFKQIQTCDLLSLDEMVRELVAICTCPVQFAVIRLSEGKYQIGDTRTIIYVRILRNHVMVRVGGGWDTLENYLDKHDPCRCETYGHKTPRRKRPTDRRGSAPPQSLTRAKLNESNPSPDSKMHQRSGSLVPSSSGSELCRHPSTESLDSNYSQYSTSSQHSQMSVASQRSTSSSKSAQSYRRVKSSGYGQQSPSNGLKTIPQTPTSTKPAATKWRRYEDNDDPEDDEVAPLNTSMPNEARITRRSPRPGQSDGADRRRSQSLGNIDVNKQLKLGQQRDLKDLDKLMITRGESGRHILDDKEVELNQKVAPTQREKPKSRHISKIQGSRSTSLNRDGKSPTRIPNGTSRSPRDRSNQRDNSLSRIPDTKQARRPTQQGSKGPRSKSLVRSKTSEDILLSAMRTRPTTPTSSRSRPTTPTMMSSRSRPTTPTSSRSRPTTPRPAKSNTTQGQLYPTPSPHSRSQSSTPTHRRASHNEYTPGTGSRPNSRPGSRNGSTESLNSVGGKYYVNGHVNDKPPTGKKVIKRRNSFDCISPTETYEDNDAINAIFSSLTKPPEASLPTERKDDKHISRTKIPVPLTKQRPRKISLPGDLNREDSGLGRYSPDSCVADLDHFDDEDLPSQISKQANQIMSEFASWHV
ncbi:unnamed protein product [Owenia fusiformis]|uniref:Uncharacterized protein n=1 Tax=Owenia fusiformis TaxID=6347 RepID=A0A8J1XLN6_OWEFU|nr:unnamed protein product [Owenia fusiformis]